MNIILAKSAGFCMGVKRALDMTLAAARKKTTVYTFGPLIHNPQVIKLLEDQDIKAIKSIANIKNKETLVIRAHGITPKQHQEIKDAGFNICDATCPHVIKVQRIIQKHTALGYTPVIIGDKGHAEVIGLLGFSAATGIVIENKADLVKLTGLKKVCIVAQTTQEEKFFLEAVTYIKEKISDVKIFNTICDATEKRQTEALELAQNLDAVIVVGGKDSANTCRLFTICHEVNPNVFFIEKVSDLNLAELKEFKKIGVTAGASTPTWLIKKIIRKINVLDEKNQNKFYLIIRRLINFSFKSDLSLAMGAAGFSFINCVIQNISPKKNFIFISLFYVLAMHILNNLTASINEDIKGSPKTEFYSRYKSFLFAIAILSIIISLLLSFSLNHTSFFLILIFTLIGALYNVKIIPKNLLKRFPYQKIKDIPGSKNIFTALGWLTVIIIFPIVASEKHYFSSKTILVGTIVFLAVLLRRILIDVKDTQNDRLIGKETLPILLGEKKTRYIINFSLIFMTILLIILIQKTIFFGILLLILPFYFTLYLILYSKKVFSSNEFMYEIIVDSSFMLIGILSFFIKFFIS